MSCGRNVELWLVVDSVLDFHASRTKCCRRLLGGEILIRKILFINSKWECISVNSIMLLILNMLLSDVQIARYFTPCQPSHKISTAQKKSHRYKEVNLSGNVVIMWIFPVRKKGLKIILFPSSEIFMEFFLPFFPHCAAVRFELSEKYHKKAERVLWYVML